MVIMTLKVVMLKSKTLFMTICDWMTISLTLSVHGHFFLINTWLIFTF